MVDEETYRVLQQELTGSDALLVAVSKTRPAADIAALYALGHRDFGENYVQELVEKQSSLPTDIRWHFIGHLQSNKVRQIAPFVHLIHGIDSFKLLLQVNKEGVRAGRVIDVLLQMHIAEEETKFGLDEKELIELLDYYTAQKHALVNVRICGLMGMGTATDDEDRIRSEFRRLRAIFDNTRQSYFIGQPHFAVLSMGMSGDYRIAISEGSNLVRIGSLLFGARQSR